MIARTTGADVTPDDFKKGINSQSPHTWSNALKPYGMQLAYCNHDLRRIEHYIDELVEHDDLFFLCFYSVNPPCDPDERGKLCTAHIVTLHKDTIYDTAKYSSSGGEIPRDESSSRSKPRPNSSREKVRRPSPSCRAPVER